MNKKDKPTQTQTLVAPIPVLENTISKFKAENDFILKTLREIERMDDGGHLLVFKDNKSTELVNQGLANVIRAGFFLKIRLDDLNVIYKDYQQYIIRMAQGHLENNKTVSFVVDNIQSKVQFGVKCTVPPENIERLRELLGIRFDELIKVDYEPKASMIQEAQENDEVAELVELTDKTPSLNWKAA